MPDVSFHSPEILVLLLAVFFIWLLRNLFIRILNAIQKSRQPGSRDDQRQHTSLLK